MKPRSLKLLFCLLFPALAFSQNQHSSHGYAVTVAGDTLRGGITGLKGIETPGLIRLAATENGKTFVFRPSDLKSFYDPAAGYFISATVSVDHSPSDKNTLRELPEPDLRQEEVFLEVLRTGKIGLCKYTLSNGRQLFFVDALMDTIFPLIDYYYFSMARESDIDAMQRDNNVHLAKYKGQLSYLMSDCEAVRSSIKSLAYSEESLCKIVDTYNNCFTQSDQSHIPAVTRKNSFFGVTAGFGVGQLTYRRDGQSYYDFRTDIPVRLAFNYEIVPSQYKGILKIQNQLGIDWFRAKASRYYSESISSHYTEDLTFSPATLIMTNNLKLSTNKKPVTLYLTIGITNSVIISCKNELRKTSTLGQSISVQYRNAVTSLNRYFFSYTAGTGIEYRNYSAEIRYEPGKAYTNEANKDIYHKFFLLLISYHF